MAHLPALLATMLLVSSPVQTTRTERLMDEIEKQVVLPKLAHPWRRYGRNYAFTSDGRVHAVFHIPPTPIKSLRNNCYDGGGKPCSDETVRNIIAMNKKEIASQALAGQRRWFSTEKELPNIADGGCSVIGLWYDLQAHRILGIGCGGYP